MLIKKTFFFDTARSLTIKKRKKVLHSKTLQQNNIAEQIQLFFLDAI